MELLFLGTSSGTPTRQRNVSGLALMPARGKSWCLVDCGEGTQHQLLRTPLSLSSLQAVCITHVHGDHCFGLPGLLSSATMGGRTAPLWVIGPAQLQGMLQCVLEVSQARFSYPLHFIDVERLSDAEIDLPFSVQAVALSHRVPSHAYVFTEKPGHRRLDVRALESAQVPQGPIWGEIQAGRDVTLQDGRALQASDFLLPPAAPRRVIVGGDNDTPALLHAVADGADVLVHEATYTEAVSEKIGPTPQHSTAARVARFAQQAGVKNLLLTHFSPRYQNDSAAAHSIDDIAEEARTHYSGRLWLANDLDHFKLDASAVLQPLNKA